MPEPWRAPSPSNLLLAVLAVVALGPLVREALHYESHGQRPSHWRKASAEEIRQHIKLATSIHAEGEEGEEDGEEHDDAHDHVGSVPASSAGTVGASLPTAGTGAGSASSAVQQPREATLTCPESSAPSYMSFVPPGTDFPGHKQYKRGQQMSILREANNRIMGVVDFELGSGFDFGGAWPGEIRLPVPGYWIGGEGLMRAEPYMPKGNGLYIKNSLQPRGTFDTFYIRLVGPSIVVGELRISQTGAGMEENTQTVYYTGGYDIREGGIYSIQIWLEYKSLPVNVTKVKNPKGDDPDPLVANKNTFPRADILLWSGLLDARYMSDSAALAGEMMRELGSASSVGGKTKLTPTQCAEEYLGGRWVARQTMPCHAEGWKFLSEPWEWRPRNCRLRQYCGVDASACVQSLKSITVAGDSIARELFDDVGSALLQKDVTWRDIFSHKHASGTREHNGTTIRMLWLPDPLKAIKEQLFGAVQNREQYTDAKVLVISAGYWYIYRFDLETYLTGIRELIDATEAVLPDTQIVWVTIPSGWMNFGYRIRPRIDHWNAEASKLARGAGWKVVDAYHLSDARPEKTDGTHIGNVGENPNPQTLNPTPSATSHSPTPQTTNPKP
mmetsp:Transcript_21205/g.67120  ORF Transcript_21205/g.67120 Transcript_21205/m.67120 type:complete len:614 (+) Transcript_21205:31-1872(+)